MTATVERLEGPRIYNLFPLLAGPMPRWRPHLERARDLGFNWIFINPISLSGHSGSLYSIRDYYTIDPRVLDPDGGAARDQLATMVREAQELGLELMTDLVINHTAFDSVLVDQHPAWYKRDAEGAMVHPGVTTGDDQTTWGDLFEIDNESSSDRDNLWEYWRQLIARLYAEGFRGFRCDAAYKVPAELWRFLIGETKRAHPDALFFAETLGCPFDEALETARTGFDFVFNSSKWWDFTEPWCLQQYRKVAAICRSVSFAESHDTERLAAELEGERQAVKMRYAFSALFTSGVMMPIGFEYGFRRRLHVVKTRPEDWEEPAFDLSGFIHQVNDIKRSHRVFNEDGPIERWDLDNPEIVALLKSSADGRERALIVLNRDSREIQTFNPNQVRNFAVSSTHVEDVSPEGRMEYGSAPGTASLDPSAVRVLYARQ